MGKYDEAISDYKVGLKYGGDKSSYFENMGIALNKKGEFKKALSLYTKAIDLDPEDPINYANRGSCYDDMEEYELAINDYCKAIKLDDGCKEAYISGSDNHEISWEKAIEIATKITENIENALEWWSDIRIVGDSEHNMVILLLLAAKKINLNDSKSIDERINQARADGYFIPESI